MAISHDVCIRLVGLAPIKWRKVHSMSAIVASSAIGDLVINHRVDQLINAVAISAFRFRIHYLFPAFILMKVSNRNEKEGDSIQRLNIQRHTSCGAAILFQLLKAS